MKTSKKLALFLLLTGVANSVYSAGACTYREAIMALERGNAVRGMALMRMAHRDGDNRATTFLASKDYPIEASPVASNDQNKSLASLNQGDSE